MSEDLSSEDSPQPDEPTQPAPVRKRRRFAWHGLRLLVLLAVAPLVFALVISIAVIDRDIRAPSWLKSRVTETASEVMGGGKVEFGEIFINIGRDLHPRVRLCDTVVSDAQDEVIARINDIAGLMSPRGIILQGDVLMQDIVLSGAQIDLRRNADGSVALAFARDTAPVDQAARLSGLLDQVDQVLGKPAFEALETIRAENLIMNYTDARAGRAWTVDGGRIELDLRDEKTVLRADLSVLAGRSTITTLTASFESPRGSHAATLGVTINDAIAADLASQNEALSWLAGFDAPLSATLRTTLDAQGELGPLSAKLEMGKGALQPNAATAPIGFEAAQAYLTFDPTQDRLTFDQIEVESDLGWFSASGQALLTEGASGQTESMIAQFQFRDLILTPSDAFPDPLKYDHAQVDLRLNFAPFSVDIGQLYIAGEGMSLTGKGAVLATPEGWQTSFDLTGQETSQAALMSLWPEGMKPRARAWAEKSVSFDEMNGLQVAVRQTPQEPLTVLGGFNFGQGAFQLKDGIVPITNASGFVSLGAGQMALSFDEGRMTPPEGGALNIAGTSIVVMDTASARPPLHIDMRLDGSITASMSLLDEPAFRFVSRAGMAVDVADGRAISRLEVDMPMSNTFADGEMQFEMETELRDFMTETLIKGRRIVGSRLALRANNDELVISGRTLFDGVPANVEWTKPLDDSGDTSMIANLQLSQDFLNTFDINLPPGSVSGASNARVAIDIPWDGTPRFTLTSNLAGLGVAIPAVGWAKPRRDFGNLRIVGNLGDKPAIDRLEISGGGLSAEGQITLNSDGSLDRAVFSELRVGNWLNAPITLRGSGGNRPYAVAIRGGEIDLRHAKFGAGGGNSGPVSIALDRLQVTEGIALTRFVGEFTGNGGFAGEFTGRMNGETELSGTVAPQNGRSAVRIRSDDAGGLVRAAGLSDNAVGGNLDLTLLPSGGEGTFDGLLAIRKIRVPDAPAMAALLDAISVVGLLQQLDGGGLSFEEVDARFRLTPDRVIVAESSAVGAGLGISLDGIYTLATQQVDFQGVVSPFYLLNSIGSVLTRRGEGLIGFNFNILGSADDPEVSVNPLSAFTPGMFRELFRRPPPVLSE